MENSSFNSQLITSIQSRLGINVLDSADPPQGMSSTVKILTDSNGKEYVVKYGNNVFKELDPIRQIKKSMPSVPVPTVYCNFTLHNEQVVVMEKISYPLLETRPAQAIGRYIPSMIQNLKKIHTITTNNHRDSWRQSLLSTFDGTQFDWKRVATHPLVETVLISDAVEKIRKMLNTIDITLSSYSLLHTDFNQRNLFIDSESDKITGIIDWEEAMYGDPVFDFARIRMLIWHYNLGEDVVQKYYSLLEYNPDERRRDDLYWLFRVIQYIGWYIEEDNDFTRARIQLHQDFLRNYRWETI